MGIETTSPQFTVLWDNDGVLVDTEGLYFEASRTVLESVGIELTPELFAEISLRRGESVFQLAAERGIVAAEIERLRAARNQRYVTFLQERAQAVEGIEAVLRSLWGRVRMGVVTSTLREHFEITHARTGFQKYLEFVVANEDYQHSKPHPEPYLTALARYDVRPEACLVVEDSERGLAAARAAGLECLVVRSRWTRDCRFPEACCVVDTVAAVLPEILRRAEGCNNAWT